MPALDPSTLFVVSAFTLALAALLLFFAWLQHRSVTALMLWAGAFALAAVVTVLVLARPYIPQFWSLIAANAILAAGYGLLWTGARLFDGRRPHLIGASAGAIAWLAACVIPAVYQQASYRASLMAVIGIIYTLLTAAELWRGRGDKLNYRLPIIILLLVHAIAIPLRVPLALFTENGTSRADLHAFILFETVLLSMCGASLFAGIVKERIALRYKRAATIDPLTGVANRRSFIERGERLLMRSNINGEPVALLLCDLDRFKAVNDEYGHAGGDTALIGFCAVACEELRAGDLFARLGGEEFACLLPDTTYADARTIAERLRSGFAARPHLLGDLEIYATVSIGLAVTGNARSDLNSLLMNADEALYRAKLEGRNRVEADDVAQHAAAAMRPMPVHRRRTS